MAKCKVSAYFIFHRLHYYISQCGVLNLNLSPRQSKSSLEMPLSTRLPCQAGWLSFLSTMAEICLGTSGGLLHSKRAQRMVDCALLLMNQKPPFEVQFRINHTQLKLARRGSRPHPRALSSVGGAQVHVGSRLPCQAVQTECKRDTAQCV